VNPWAQRVIPGAAIVLFVFCAYLPALHGGFVWDDDSWTTGIIGLLRDTSGLRLIWFKPTALQQYYPLSGTTFWLDYQLWRFWTTPYHVENILLHALAALLFWRLLLRLQVPGAWLASATFALHPVMVESVAWIAERKNVLSLVFYLGALLAYLRFLALEKPGGPNRLRWRWYLGAVILFLAALLSKTVTCSLPAAILLIGWWKRGRIRWRADVLPTLPFFAVALGLCAVTAWLEKNHLGAQGPGFALTFPQRCLIAGRAFWFYLGTLFWPANLCFVAPRWQPNPGVWWQWLYRMTAVGTLFTLWLARTRIGRGPITAMCFFVGTLFPVLGFLNAYGMRYSFVWNHWVYLSALGMIALVAATVVRAAESLRTPAMVYGFAAIVLPMLAFLTWQQAGMYTNVETLWRATLARNPDSWMAHNNLGTYLYQEGRPAEATEHYHMALQVNPNSFETLKSLGNALAAQGRFDEAIQSYHQAIRIKPDYSDALNDLGVALVAQGRFDEAITNYHQALQINPHFPQALDNLGVALAAQSRFNEAIETFLQSIQLNSNRSDTFFHLGMALDQSGRTREAAARYREALGLNPNLAGALNNLAWVLATSPDDGLRKGAEAVQLAERACQLTQYRQPSFVGTLAAAYAEAGRFDDAIATAQKAIALAEENHQPDLLQKARELLQRYRAHKPYHEAH
jgi:Flp pilus assembly protein TadD